MRPSSQRDEQRVLADEPCLGNRTEPRCRSTASLAAHQERTGEIEDRRSRCKFTGQRSQLRRIERLRVVVDDNSRHLVRYRWPPPQQDLDLLPSDSQANPVRVQRETTRGVHGVSSSQSRRSPGEPHKSSVSQLVFVHWLRGHPKTQTRVVGHRP